MTAPPDKPLFEDVPMFDTPTESETPVTEMAGTHHYFHAIRQLQGICGTSAEAKGFHDDRPTPGALDDKTPLLHWQGNKIALMHSELSEALEELRNGTAANHTYHPKIEGKELKPEGVPSELADVVIRVLDFCYTENIDLAAVMEEKLAYNATRERLHGRSF